MTFAQDKIMGEAIGVEVYLQDGHKLVYQHRELFYFYLKNGHTGEGAIAEQS